MTDLTISDRLARYGITHEAAGANGRLLSHKGRSIGFAHSDHAVNLLELLDGLSHKRDGDEGEVNQATRATGDRPEKGGAL